MTSRQPSPRPSPTRPFTGTGAIRASASLSWSSWGPGTAPPSRVRDSGDGFDADALPDPTHPSNLFNPSGRGVFLMRRLVDELEYNDKGNCVRLTVRRQQRRKP